ncbi:hypothetical protein TSOC_002598 [Tetrabaena socialis]|uniref:Uncharacterized protein n=1 Tax=Tetrabaena socialis TaxID=47790 RepID=A0A2J8ADR9_9CHLO|nr:hypothetical protein TSOC_002598 [Tetrabaena socialis]|eukprot:PNH10654.1 hypothetical protein TSOC_002598 [Tetrabaena socialis]
MGGGFTPQFGVAGGNRYGSIFDTAQAEGDLFYTSTNRSSVDKSTAASFIIRTASRSSLLILAARSDGSGWPSTYFRWGGGGG